MEALQLDNYLVDSNNNNNNAFQKTNSRFPSSLTLIVLGTLFFIVAFIVALFTYPIAGILVVGLALVFAKIFIKRKHLTVIEEEYAPDIYIEDFRALKSTVPPVKKSKPQKLSKDLNG